MIDSATVWIEIRSVPEARADLVTYEVELAWLIIYPLPNIYLHPLPNMIMVDRGKKV